MRFQKKRPSLGRRRRAFTFATGLAAVGLAVAAASTSAATRGAWASARAAASGTLNVSFLGPPILGLNPADVAGGQSNIYMSLAYDSLTYTEPNGKLVPDLATSWTWLDKSHKKLELTLRRGVHFSDGSTMTAGGVVKWLKYFETTKGIDNGELAQMTSAKATGRLQLVITLSSPNPDLPQLLSQTYGAGMVASVKGMANPKSLADATDGAGPYELDPGATVVNSSYTYVRNPHYWNPSAVHFAKVVVKALNTPTSIESAVAGGQVNVALEADASTVSQAKSAGINVVSAPAAVWGMWIMDRSGKLVAALGKPAVRQAINYAIDRPGIVKALNPNGYATATSQMGVPQEAGYSKALNSLYGYNIAKAKSLLTSAGYPNGFTFTALCTPLLNTCSLAQAVASSLQQVGITMNIDSETEISVFSQKFSGGTDPVVFFNAGGPAFLLQQGIIPPTTYQNPFHSTNPTITAAYNALGAAQTSAQADTADAKLIKAEASLGWFAPVEVLDNIYYVKGVTNVALEAANPDYYSPVDPTGKYSWRP